MPSSAIGSILENMLGSVIESILRAHLRVQVRQAGGVSQAGWECTSERIWKRANKCIWQFGFKFVECSMMYSIKRT